MSDQKNNRWISTFQIAQFYDVLLEYNNNKNDNNDCNAELYQVTKNVLSRHYKASIINKLEYLINKGIDKNEIINIFINKDAFQKYIIMRHNNNLKYIKKNITINEINKFNKFEKLKQLWKLDICKKDRFDTVYNTICPICYDAEIQCELSCKHGYCLCCYTEYYQEFRTSAMQTCAICREQVNDTLIISQLNSNNDGFSCTIF